MHGKREQYSFYKPYSSVAVYKQSRVLLAMTSIDTFIALALSCDDVTLVVVVVQVLMGV